MPDHIIRLIVYLVVTLITMGILTYAMEEKKIDGPLPLAALFWPVGVVLIPVYYGFRLAKWVDKRATTL